MRGLSGKNLKYQIPNELSKKYLDTLHYGHAGTTTMAEEAEIFWWPNITQDIEERVKKCVASPVRT